MPAGEELSGQQSMGSNRFASVGGTLAIGGRRTLPSSKWQDSGSYLDNWKKEGEILTSTAESGFHVLSRRESEKGWGLHAKLVETR